VTASSAIKSLLSEKKLVNAQKLVAFGQNYQESSSTTCSGETLFAFIRR
jgi:hypothetical protein